MSFRFVLAKYLKEDNHKYADQIIYQDKDFVLIKDAFPKSIIHWLLLPKDPKITYLNPLSDAFKNESLKNKVIDLIPIIEELILKEISNQGYEVINDEGLIKIGVHAVPSLANLHIHFITKDLNSDKMKRKHHYNSFTTNFFVNFNELPLNQNDSRLNPKEMENHCSKDDLICAFCKQNFTNQFAQLKRHLKEKEFKKIFIKKTEIEVIEID